MQDATLAPIHAFRRRHPPVYHDVAGACWETIRAGEGDETLLLLPGAMGYAETSFEYVTAFAGRYRVLSLAYPPSIARASELLAGLVAVLDKERVTAAHVAGGSYSGLVAQSLAGHYPARVRSLILNHTAAPDPARAVLLRLLLGVLWPLPTVVLHALMRAGIRGFLPAETPVQAFWRAYFRDIIPRFSRREVLNRLRVLIELEGAEPVASAWQGPVLIVQAERDRFVSRRAAVALHDCYPQARTVTLADTGHSAALETIAHTIEIYRAFLHEIGGDGDDR